MRPNYFVRIISKRTKVVDCIVRLRNSNYGDLSVAVELAQWIFDDEHSWSIYAMKCRHRHDEGHACGLMAATIASDDFNENARRRCKEKVQRWLTAKMKNQDASRDDLVELINQEACEAGDIGRFRWICIR